jgi:MFS superfamily sulfate permease-like transporter
MTPTGPAVAKTAHQWPVLRSLAGYDAQRLPGDAIAGLTLAAIAVPEQMATSRLGGFTPETGFFVFIAAAVGFFVFGASRRLSAGADSTITPIFAGGLAVLAETSSPQYGGLAALLALMVGLILIGGAVFRLGWIADLLSAPVLTGFLAGIAVHIAVSQLPETLGIPAPSGSLPHQVAAIVTALNRTNLYSLGIAVGVITLVLASERGSAKIPGALIALAAASVAVPTFGLRARGVDVLGSAEVALPRFGLPGFDGSDIFHLLPLAFIIATVVMVQTAATTRSFATDDDPPDVNRDFLGVGVANALCGFIGGFPVNASPPRTAIVFETGGKSQLAGLFAAGIVLVVALFGADLLATIPRAALAGILLFVAQRIVRVGSMVDIYRRSGGEFLLILATAAAIVALPIEIGVAVGIVLSLLHGIWTTTRTVAVEFQRLPGTTIWWPRTAAVKGETLPGVAVVAFQAPLSFLNAYDFDREIRAIVAGHSAPVALVVLEASGIVTIDYTAANVLASLIRHFREAGIDFAFSRLESVRAQGDFARFGLIALVGEDHLFHSAEEAVRRLAAHATLA